jgi:AraC-like DNA-binding protein
MSVVTEHEDDRIVGGKPAKVVFNSDALPEADDRKRFALWRDQWNALYGSVELTRADQRRFSVNLEFLPVGAVGLGCFNGTISRISRTARDVAADGADNFCLTMQCRQSASVRQSGRETRLDQASAVLLTNAEPGEVCAGDGMGWFAVNVSHKHLLQLVANAEDLIGVPLDADNEALRHLQRYLAVLLAPEGIGSNPALIERVGSTVVDLVALALGAGSDAAEAASLRGLRAARLQAVLAAIRSGFADASFSSLHVAIGLGLSRRYVNDLLHETGTSFAERVMELRLQKARAMLADRGNDRLKVSEIAYACGFNEVSYFNRCFRARFGASPSEYRGSGSSRS